MDTTASALGEIQRNTRIVHELQIAHLANTTTFVVDAGIVVASAFAMVASQNTTLVS